AEPARQTSRKMSRNATLALIAKKARSRQAELGGGIHAVGASPSDVLGGLLHPGCDRALLAPDAALAADEADSLLGVPRHARQGLGGPGRALRHAHPWHRQARARRRPEELRDRPRGRRRAGARAAETGRALRGPVRESGPERDRLLGAPRRGVRR